MKIYFAITIIFLGFANICQPVPTSHGLNIQVVAPDYGPDNSQTPDEIRAVLKERQDATRQADMDTLKAVHQDAHDKAVDEINKDQEEKLTGPQSQLDPLQADEKQLIDEKNRPDSTIPTVTIDARLKKNAEKQKAIKSVMDQIKADHQEQRQAADTKLEQDLGGLDMEYNNLIAQRTAERLHDQGIKIFNDNKTKAGDPKDVIAQTTMGDIYQYGTVVDQNGKKVGFDEMVKPDWDTAIMYYKKAADQNYPTAVDKLAKLTALMHTAAPPQ